MSIESVPYPTRELSEDFPLFLSDIGAVPVPISVSGTQTIAATKGSTYITYGSGTITFTDPDVVSGDHYKVIVGGTCTAVIGNVSYTEASPVEILRLVSNGTWVTYGGVTLNGTEVLTNKTITGNFTGPLSGNVTGNVTGSAGSFTGSLAGDVSGTQSATAISDATVTRKFLTGYVSSTGTIGTSDTILSAIGKLNGNKADAVAPIVSLTANTTFEQNSNAKIFHVTGTRTLTLPVASTVSDGWSIGVVNVGGASLTIARSNTDTINGTLTTFNNTLPYSAFYIYKSGSTSFVAIGVLY